MQSLTIFYTTFTLFFSQFFIVIRVLGSIHSEKKRFFIPPMESHIIVTVRVTPAAGEEELQFDSNIP